MTPPRVIVLSRRRSHNMPVIRELLPSATICVDDRERDDYRAMAPDDRLLFHPPMEVAATVRNWIIEHVPDETVVMIDDDFCGVKVTVGSHRFITSAEEIIAIIENTARCAADLDLGCFCWSGTPNTTIIRPGERPIYPTQPVFRAFGIRGTARHRAWRTDLPGRADVDWTLRTLLLDRCVFADVRFFFDCGPVLSGRGGNVGLISAEQFDKASRELRRTWGRAISFKAPAYVKKREVASLSLRVARANKTAQK